MAVVCNYYVSAIDRMLSPANELHTSPLESCWDRQTTTVLVRSTRHRCWTVCCPTWMVTTATACRPSFLLTVVSGVGYRSGLTVVFKCDRVLWIIIIKIFKQGTSFILLVEVRFALSKQWNTETLNKKRKRHGGMWWQCKETQRKIKQIQII